MNIQELYDALDALEEDARSTAEDFATTGDLTALGNRLDSIGTRAFEITRATATIRQALKLED